MIGISGEPEERKMLPIAQTSLNESGNEKCLPYAGERTLGD
jgi:hypothetical protein